MDVMQLLQKSYDIGASDIHLFYGEPPSFRKHQRLIDADGYHPLTQEDLEKAVKFLVPENRLPDLETGDLDLSYQTDFCRFRVNICTERKGYSLTLRLIPETVPSISKLGVPDVVLSTVTKSQGLVLVVGPTGSGKSTTIASTLDYLNSNFSHKIVTLEDPIEYVHKNKKSRIIQREIGTHTESFSKGLRAALRQDPDIIAVGELRDLETISTAITAAETGHLVFGTLHTASAGQTIDRIIDVFPEHQQSQIRFQVATKLLMIISQRLIPRSDRDGSIAAFEILKNTNGISNLIRLGQTHKVDNELRTGKRHGMIILEDSLKDLQLQGVISSETAERFKNASSEL